MYDIIRQTISHRDQATAVNQLRVNCDPTSRKDALAMVKNKFPLDLNLLFFEVSLSLSGGFTPCRHLRPSSGRDQTIV